jgi:hypothetical protein
LPVIYFFCRIVAEEEVFHFHFVPYVEYCLPNFTKRAIYLKISASNLYFGCARFESRPGYRPS